MSNPKQPKPKGWRPPGAPPSLAILPEIAIKSDGIRPTFDAMLRHQTACEDCFWHPYDGKGWQIDACPVGKKLEDDDQWAMDMLKAIEQLPPRKDPKDEQ